MGSKSISSSVSAFRTLTSHLSPHLTFPFSMWGSSAFVLPLTVTSFQFHRLAFSSAVTSGPSPSSTVAYISKDLLLGLGFEILIRKYASPTSVLLPFPSFTYSHSALMTFIGPKLNSVNGQPPPSLFEVGMLGPILFKEKTPFVCKSSYMPALFLILFPLFEKNILVGFSEFLLALKL